MSQKRITIIVVAFVICFNLPGIAGNNFGVATRNLIPSSNYSFPCSRLSSFNILQKDNQYNGEKRGTGTWEQMYFRSIKINDKFVCFIVSSELVPMDPFEGLGKYGGHNLFDDNPATAWVEGVKGQGTGEYVIFKTEKQFPQEIQIFNGYQKSDRLYRLNSRPHTLFISIYAGFFLEGDDTEIASRYRVKQITEPKIIELDNRMGSQSFVIPFNEKNVSPLKDSLIKALHFDLDYLKGQINL